MDFVLFFIVLHYFCKEYVFNQQPIMKRKSINILFLLLIIISCQNSRPHGGNEIPPLTRNNYLMGFFK